VTSTSLVAPAAIVALPGVTVPQVSPPVVLQVKVKLALKLPVFTTVKVTSSPLVLM